MPGATTLAGYGNQHQKTRRKYQRLVDTGQAYCTEPICLMSTRWIPPGTRWDLAHLLDEHGRKVGYRGPAHPRCNRSEGASRGNRMRGRVKHSRRWI